MTRRGTSWRWGFAIASCLACPLACSDTTQDRGADAGTGGKAQPEPNTGGATPNTGGAPATGGSPRTGGAPTSGGATATGGKPPTPPGDAGDAGDAGAICEDTERKWSDLLAEHVACNTNDDCTEMEDGEYCSCMRIQVVFNKNARSTLHAFVAEVAHSCPANTWPGCGYDYGPLKDIRCENHQCVAELQSCLGRLDGG